MTAIEMMLRMFRAQVEAINELVGGISAECLNWQPDDGANSINHTVWHLARSADVVANVIMPANSLDNQAWYRSGWVEKTGYDPAGLGYQGWGILTGYTQEQVAGVPLLSADNLRHYFNEVYTALLTGLENSSADIFDQPCTDVGAPMTNYFWYDLTLVDNIRHTGEMLAIKAMWERKNQRETDE